MTNNECTSHEHAAGSDELWTTFAGLGATETSSDEPPMWIRAGSETASAAPDAEESDDTEDEDEDDEDDEDDDEDDGDEDDEDDEDDDEGEEEELE
jgi:hypothetical protein